MTADRKSVHSSEETDFSTALPWYAIYVRSNFERVVDRHLQGRGLETFLPTYKSERRWSDRIKELELPLFPGYLFCRLDLEDRLPVVKAPGVVQILGHGKKPAPVPESEVEAVRAILRSKLPYMPWSYASPGQPVIVERGPLMGVQGVLLEGRGPHRIAVSINMLQRSVAVELDISWIRPAPQPFPQIHMYAHA